MPANRGAASDHAGAASAGEHCLRPDDAPVSAAEGAKFSAVMNDFVEKVTALGENKKIADIRVKEEL